MTELEFILIQFFVLFAFIVGLLMFLTWLYKNTARIVYWDSETTASIHFKKIKNETITYDKKLHYLSRIKPYLLKGMFGWQPLLLLNWRSTTPLTVFPQQKTEKISPELMKNIYQRKSMETITKPAPSTRKEQFFMIIVGGLAGFGVGFIIARGLGGI